MPEQRLLTWINGELRDPAEATISVFDRGFLFGDAVYELVRFFDGVGVGMDHHVTRLERSLREAGIVGFEADAYPVICDALLDGLGTRDACVYLQVTRGVQTPRAHLPSAGIEPTVVAIASPSAPLSELDVPLEIPVALVPDLRRARCDIKATSLLENVLATMEADRIEAVEPVLHHEGRLTEGGSSNVFVVESDRILTPSLRDPRPILEGVTRRLVREAAESLGREFRETSIGLESFRSCREAFIGSSRRLIAAITSIDGRPVGDGRPGAVTMELFNELRRRIADRESVVRTP